MDNIKKQIEKLQNCILNRGVKWSVYDFNAYTTQELIFQMCQKINETIDNVEEFTKLTLALYDFITGEGLQNAVNEKLDEMFENGQLAEIIDKQIFGSLKVDIENLKEELKNYKSEVEQIVDGMLEDMQQTINENIKDINDKMNEIIENFVSKYSKLFDFDLQKIAGVRHGYIMIKKTRVGQGLGINNYTGELFGSRVYNDSKPSEDYMITRFNHSGEEISSIIFENGGHGTSFGVEAVYNHNTFSYDTYIWSNVNIVNSLGNITGNKVVRYKYDDNVNTLNLNSTGVQVINTGSSLYTIPVLNDIHDLACMVRKQNGKYYIEVYKMSDLKKGVIDKIGHVDLSQNDYYLQGVAITEDFIFWRVGNADGSIEDITYVYDWRKNKYLYKIKTGNLKPLLNESDITENFREPEGICVYTNPLNNAKSLFTMTIIGGSNRRKHVIHAYHQLGNGGIFGTAVNGQAQQKAFTKPDGQALDIPRHYTELSQVKEIGHYYIEGSQYKTFTDRPLKDNEEGWFLFVSGKKNSYTIDSVQVMIRNSSSETDVYIRLNRPEGGTPWVAISSLDALRSQSVGNVSYIKDLNKTNEYYISTVEFNNMLDKPEGAISSGYFLRNGAKAQDGTFIQTLIQNSVNNTPHIYHRCVNKTKSSRWFKTTIE